MDEYSYILHQVLVHTLSSCNLKCKHCYAKEFEEKLTLDELKKLFDEMKILGASLCHLSGGEFLLRDDFESVVDYANQLFPFVELTTNGTLLNQDICKKLKGKITKLIISLEGHDKISNDYIRGEGGFDIVIQSIKLAINQGINVGINFTITKLNFKYVPDMVSLSNELKVNFVNFRRFIPVGEGKINKEMELSSGEYLELNKLVLSARKNNKNITMAGDPTRTLFQNQEDIKNITIGGCMAGIALLSINPNGDVTPCGYMNYTVGNIKNDSLIDIRNNSDVLKRLRDRNNLVGKCGSCNNKKACGGCRASAYAYSKDIFSGDQLCWLHQ